MQIALLKYIHFETPHHAHLKLVKSHGIYLREDTLVSNNSTTNSLHHESIGYEDYDYLQIHEISSKSSLSTTKSLLFYTKKAGLDSPTFQHVIKNYFNVTEAPTSSS